MNLSKIIWSLSCGLLRRRMIPPGLAVGALAGGGLLLGVAGPTVALAATSRCAFPNAQYKHVIYVQFDNTHLRRDNPNVPSDLEQIPALKNFLAHQGSLLSNDHTILISHTAGGIVSTLTGLYPDRNGINVSNSYQYFTGSPTSTAFTSAFKYWTDPVSSSDSLPNVLTNHRANTPAPWAAFTRAGCDVGAVGTANLELENTSTAPGGDVTSVFGRGVPGLSSPQAAIANADGTEATADLEGIALHCSRAHSTGAGPCSVAHGGVADKLPGEPGGYGGYKGLFGALYVNQHVAAPRRFVPASVDASSPTFAGRKVPSRAPTVFDVYHYRASAAHRHPATQPITDGHGHAGFMGFDPSAAQGLGYVAQMQEAGVPVTMAYLADVHDDHSNLNHGNAFGPGQAGYEAQLHGYNQAFAAFFDRLRRDGINKHNTLFVFTVDEGDHYAGGPPTNPSCDGAHVPCRYASGPSGPNTVGEQNVDLVNALAREKHDTIPFDVHADSAPTVYVRGSSSTSGPGANDPNVRRLERDASGLTLVNARTGKTDVVTQHIADQADQSILHMVNGDPSRTPSFTLFGNPDFYYQQEGKFGYTCQSASTPPGCPVVANTDAWNHGDDNPQIARTWVGFAGPSIRSLGSTGSIWTDHTDVRPTMLAALGLRPDYVPDGRLIAQTLRPSALPAGVGSAAGRFDELAGAYKQLNAPFGRFGHASEIVSTRAVQSRSSGDAVYRAWDAQLRACGSARDVVAAEIRGLLDRVEFGGARLGRARVRRMVRRSRVLIAELVTLSRARTPPRAMVCRR